MNGARPLELGHFCISRRRLSVKPGRMKKKRLVLLDKKEGLRR
jgi:hypothetical protein